jgi:hypothetical protein
MKKQNLVRAFLMAALLVGTFAVAGNDAYAQDTGNMGSGCCRGTSQSDGGGTIGSGTLQSSGGMLGSGTATGGGGMIGSGSLTEDGGGTIGSGTRTGLIGPSGGKTADSSFFYTLMRYFGF